MRDRKGELKASTPPGEKCGLLERSIESIGNVVWQMEMTPWGQPPGQGCMNMRPEIIEGVGSLYA